jgi:hypothetical protein
VATKLSVLLVAVLLVQSCHRSSPSPFQPNLTAPEIVETPDPYSGKWAGTVSDEVRGAGTLALELSKTTLGNTGTWTVAFSGSTEVSGRANILIRSAPTASLSLTCVPDRSMISLTQLTGDELNGE